MTIKNIK